VGNKIHKPALFYTPRILSVILLLTLGFFASEAHQAADLTDSTRSPFAVYLLPVFILLLITTISWKRARFGGTLFIVGGLFYFFGNNQMSATSLILVSAPLILLGILFHISQYFYEK